MKAIMFEQVNLELGKDQPQYETLPVCQVGDEQGQVIGCFELSEEEVERMLQEGGKVWFGQLTFGNAFQPMWLSVDNPFDVAEAEVEAGAEIDEEVDVGDPVDVVGWRKVYKFLESIEDLSCPGSDVHELARSAMKELDGGQSDEN